MFGILASCCWFIAFSQENAALVKTIGQIEVILSIFISLKIFKESFKINEVIAIICICLAIVGISLN